MFHHIIPQFKKIYLILENTLITSFLTKMLRNSIHSNKNVLRLYITRYSKNVKRIEQNRCSEFAVKQQKVISIKLRMTVHIWMKNERKQI